MTLAEELTRDYWTNRESSTHAVFIAAINEALERAAQECAKRAAWYPLASDEHGVLHAAVVAIRALKGEAND